MIGRFIDRDLVVVLAAVRSFVDPVRDGDAGPEQVEDVLRESLDDPTLRVLLTVPRRNGLTGLDGEQFDTDRGVESRVTLT